MSEKVLIVDDDRSICKMLEKLLAPESIDYDVVGTGEHALQLLEKELYSVVLLDIMLPGISGYEVAKKIRQMEHCKKTMIIFMSEKNSEEEICYGLDGFAHDYCPKPFTTKILVQKVQNYIRLLHGEKTDTLSFNDMTLDQKKFTLTHGEKVVDLKAGEALLLAVFFSSPEHCFSREELIIKSGRDQKTTNGRTIDNLVHSLRKKCEEFPFNIKNLNRSILS